MLQFWRLEVWHWSYWAIIKASSRLHSFLETVMENPFPCLLQPLEGTHIPRQMAHSSTFKVSKSQLSCSHITALWLLSRVTFPSDSSSASLPFFFSKIMALLRYNSHGIQFTHLKCTSHWFLAYSQSCVTIIIINFGTFLTPLLRNLITISSYFPFPLKFLFLDEHSSIFCLYEFSYSRHFR